MSTTRTSRPLSSGPRPLQLVDGNVQPAGFGSPSTSSCPSPTASGLSTPPPTARSFKKSRRQSSISYFPSDNAPTWSSRSTTMITAPSLKRSTSVGHGAKSPIVSSPGDRRSLGSPAELQSPYADRGPLTLTEKCVDLLFLPPSVPINSFLDTRTSCNSSHRRSRNASSCGRN